MILTKSRAVVDLLMQSLKAVRTEERTEPFEIKHTFGNLEHNAHTRDYRIDWIHQGGLVLERIAAPAAESEEKDADGNPIATVPAIGYRKATYMAKIYAPGEYREEAAARCERILDQLVTASLQLAHPDTVSFTNAPYKFKTETDGKWNEKMALLEAIVYIRSSVPAIPIGGTIDVVVTGYQFKDGIYDTESSVDDIPDDKFEQDRVDPEPTTWETENVSVEDWDG